MKWIRSKRKLPEHLDLVLFLYSDSQGSEILTGWYDRDNKEWVCSIVGFLRDVCEMAYDDCHFKKTDVTHWTQIPPKPEE